MFFVCQGQELIGPPVVLANDRDPLSMHGFSLGLSVSLPHASTGRFGVRIASKWNPRLILIRNVKDSWWQVAPCHRCQASKLCTAMSQA